MSVEGQRALPICVVMDVLRLSHASNVPSAFWCMFERQKGVYGHSHGSQNKQESSKKDPVDDAALNELKYAPSVRQL